MNRCPECGLPIKACNAFAYYKMAARSIRYGQIEEAKQDIARAEEWYERFLAEHRAAAVNA